MEEETTPSPEYIKGFNEGYILAQETPDLAKKLSKIEASTDRLKGFKDGKTQYLNERIREQRNKIFERPWDKGKSHSPDVTKDLEKDIDIEPEL